MDPSFFGLTGHPFAKPEAAEAPCLAQEHLALSAELNAGLKAPHGITLLIGEQGTGKSTFIRNFLAQLPDSYVVAYLPTAGPGLRHLLTEIVEQLGGTVAAGGQEQALIDTLRSLARARAEHDRATLVVIDDAHELPAKTIERLGKLFGADTAEPSRLHVTLVGRPELLDRMNAANDRSILKHLVQACRRDRREGIFGRCPSVDRAARQRKPGANRRTLLGCLGAR
jgi:type II secretory pathway predicted ATPase ExeA